MEEAALVALATSASITTGARGRWGFSTDRGPVSFSPVQNGSPKVRENGAVLEAVQLQEFALGARLNL